MSLGRRGPRLTRGVLGRNELEDVATGVGDTATGGTDEGVGTLDVVPGVPRRSG